MKSGHRLKPISSIIERKGGINSQFSLFYYGESAVGVDDVKWHDKHSGISREFAWECAIETGRIHTDEEKEKKLTPHPFFFH